MAEAAKDKEKRGRELADLLWVMNDAKGRAVVRRLLERLNVGGTVFRPVGGLGQDLWPVYNGAWQDFGNWLTGECTQADPSYRTYAQMNLEAQNRKVMEAEASRLKQTEENEQDGD